MPIPPVTAFPVARRTIVLPGRKDLLAAVLAVWRVVDCFPIGEDARTESGTTMQALVARAALQIREQGTRNTQATRLCFEYTSKLLML